VLLSSGGENRLLRLGDVTGEEVALFLFVPTLLWCVCALAFCRGGAG
jgi:hypothetical protein